MTTPLLSNNQSRDIEPLLRKPAVLAQTGYSAPTLYRRVADGLFTPPVKCGARISAWPASEVRAVNAAVIAGRAGDEIRALVRELVAARAQTATAAA